MFYSESPKKNWHPPWVAQQLKTGRWGCVSHLLKRKTKSANFKDTGPKSQDVCR